MLRVQIYPVMDGLEVWMAWSCGSNEGPHLHHRNGSVHRYLSAEEIAERGQPGAVAHELTIALHEFSEAAESAGC